MADVVNRTTKQYLKSVNTPDYSEDDWIVNPDLSGVDGVPTKYWKITGDVVTEMNQAEKDAVDAAEPVPPPRGNTIVAIFTGRAEDNSNRYLSSEGIGTSDSLPAVCIATSTLTMLVFSGSGTSPSGVIELRLNTTTGAPAASITLTGTQTQVSSLNLPTTQGDTLNCKIAAGASGIDKPVVKLYSMGY